MISAFFSPSSQRHSVAENGAGNHVPTGSNLRRQRHLLAAPQRSISRRNFQRVPRFSKMPMAILCQKRSICIGNLTLSKSGVLNKKNQSPAMQETLPPWKLSAVNSLDSSPPTIRISWRSPSHITDRRERHRDLVMLCHVSFRWGCHWCFMTWAYHES